MKSKKKKSREAAMDVADRLHSAAIHLLRHVRKQDVATREAPARLSALSVLVFGGPVTLGQLAAAEQVKPPTMTRIVTGLERRDRKSTRLNSSHGYISYAVFCLKKKKKIHKSLIVLIIASYRSSS